LNFNDPPLELLVLSACQTALGDEDAVLGFAGSFLDADVKSVLASLWYVNDLASLLYMMEFYRNLSTGLTKAEAVQNTQRAFLDEQRTIQNLRELDLVVKSILADDRSREKLTEAELERLQRLSIEIQPDRLSRLAEELTHPFYWSAYTLVGNPW
jgi:CHAT domain-containing protein